jgi:hypothetical protein
LPEIGSDGFIPGKEKPPTGGGSWWFFDSEAIASVLVWKQTSNGKEMNN